MESWDNYIERKSRVEVRLWETNWSGNIVEKGRHVHKKWYNMIYIFSFTKSRHLYPLWIVQYPKKQYLVDQNLSSLDLYGWSEEKYK